MKKASREHDAIDSGARVAGLRRISRRHVSKPGEIKLADCKVRVTMYLDGDVLEHFKTRAAQPNAAPYQTQVNSELRSVMERDNGGEPYASLVSDERFITAVAKRVSEHRPRRGYPPAKQR